VLARVAMVLVGVSLLENRWGVASWHLSPNFTKAIKNMSSQKVFTSRHGLVV
jgi:hypothetical protein